MEEQFEPFITFLMCSRRLGNPDSNIVEFFNSVDQHLEDWQKTKIEFLVKFDTDDEDSGVNILNRNKDWEARNLKEQFAQPNRLKEFPFSVRHFVYARGEGRRSLHNDYMFLFSQRNPKSKFVSFVTDDCIMINDGMFTELERLKDREWCFMGDKRPQADIHKNYRDHPQAWRNDVSMFPIVSTRIIECVQNMGWQVNVDNWITLLHVILVNKYGLDLWEGSYNQYVGRGGGASKECQYGERYNPMEVNNIMMVDNPYYFDLVEQQAKNIALNYYEDKTKEILRQWVK